MVFFSDGAFRCPPVWTPVRTVAGPAALLAALVLAPVAMSAGCSKAPPVTLWVDGFAPENVSFDVIDLGPLDDAALAAQKARPDVDGVMALPPGSCPGPCRAAQVSVFVANRGTTPEPPPVIRLDAPTGKARRLPIAFRVPQVDPGRTGRVRWVVQLWPEEQQLTATLSSSVALDVKVSSPPSPTSPPISPPPPTQGPTPGANTPPAVPPPPTSP